MLEFGIRLDLNSQTKSLITLCEQTAVELMWKHPAVEVSGVDAARLTYIWEDQFQISAVYLLSRPCPLVLFATVPRLMLR